MAAESAVNHPREQSDAKERYGEAAKRGPDHAGRSLGYRAREGGTREEGMCCDAERSDPHAKEERESVDR